MHCIRSSFSIIGNDFPSAQHLLESLWAYEEWKTENHIESDTEFVHVRRVAASPR